MKQASFEEINDDTSFKFSANVFPVTVKQSPCKSPFSNKYFPVNIKHADETYPYYFLLIAKENQPIIYKESIYFDWLEDQPIKINSLMDTLEKNDEFMVIKPKNFK